MMEHKIYSALLNYILFDYKQLKEDKNEKNCKFKFHLFNYKYNFVKLQNFKN